MAGASLLSPRVKGGYQLYPDARHPVIGAHLAQLWHLPTALIDGDGAPGMKHTAGRWPKRAGHIACQDDALPLRLDKYVKDFNDSWGVFLNLYRYESAPKALGGATRHTVFMNLVKAYFDDKESSLSIPLLFTTRTVKENGVTRYSRRFLAGLFGWEGEDGPDGASSSAIRLFWIRIKLS